MPNPKIGERMTEKQASSEIAQSRERFEKFGESKRWDLSKFRDTGNYINPEVRGAFWGWEQAERDTRERVAQLAKDIAKEVGGNFAETHRLNVGLNKFMKELERIRGKE